MKLLLCLISLSLIASCSNTASDKKAEDKKEEPTAEKSTGKKDDTGIVGAWTQEFTCFDKNGNLILDPEERVPAEYKNGFNWFRFNDDGTCERDSDLKLKGTYNVEGTGAKRELLITPTSGMGSEVYKYTIQGDIKNELVLSGMGTFMIFKRS